ncbi:coiled-coil domain-containing protein 106b [Engraulis encrasicolus]|uniref:coiled-coil domain-containing protein 106b n=1 Tax=Engraulis encrasicolus TaxID=184585 RepID=UPI002FCE974D
MADAHSSTGTTPDKRKGGFEISIPFENGTSNNSGDPATNGSNPNEPPFEVSSINVSTGHLSVGQQAPCDSYLLIANLRMHLQISLEKNSWQQKRIEDLEEERDFLRCQLDRLINITKNQEFIERQTESPQGLIPNPPASPFPVRTAPLLRSAVARQQPRLKMQGSIQAEEYEDVMEEYLEEDGYLEEEMVSEDDGGKKSKRGKAGDKTSSGGGCVKRTRLFRIKRGMERQRVKDPAGVLLRYKKILVTYQKLKSMSKAFQMHGVDRNTVASTTPIAELLLVAPEKVPEVGEFDPGKEKLLDYARRCYKALDEETQLKVQALKKTHLLLPISYRFRTV